MTTTYPFDDSSLIAGGTPRKVVSLNSNYVYQVDKSRKMRRNPKTKKMMRPVKRIDKNTNKTMYKTYVNVVDTIPFTKAATKRARRAARKRKLSSR